MNRVAVSALVGLVAVLAFVVAENPVGYRSNSYHFHGYYPGRCGNDGFYYKDHYSFVICSNGNAYDQPCAPGTRNSEYGRYNHGHSYYYRDFCDVNLVDYGFGAHHEPGYGGYGHQPRHDGYGYRP